MMSPNAAVEIVAHVATYGKPVQVDDGPVVPGIEHGLTSWSERLPAELTEICRPRILIPIDANPMRVVHNGADDAGHERGALVVVPVVIRANGGGATTWVVSGRMRPYKEDGKGGVGRPMTLMHSWAISAGQWSACAPKLIQHIGANLEVKPDIAAAVAGQRRILKSLTFSIGTGLPELPVKQLLLLKGIWGILDGIYEDRPTQWSGETFKSEREFLTAMACVMALLPRRDPTSPAALIPFCSGLALGREQFLVSYLAGGPLTSDETGKPPSSRFSSLLDPDAMLSDIPQRISRERGIQGVEPAIGHYNSKSWHDRFAREIRDCIDECWFTKPARPQRKPALRVEAQPAAVARPPAPSPAIAPPASHLAHPATSPSGPAPVEMTKPTQQLDRAAKMLASFKRSRSAADSAEIEACLRDVGDRAAWRQDSTWDGEMLYIERNLGGEVGPYVAGLLGSLRSLARPDASSRQPVAHQLRFLEAILELCQTASQQSSREIEKTAVRIAETTRLQLVAFYENAYFLDGDELVLTERSSDLRKAYEFALTKQRAFAGGPAVHWLVLRHFGSPHGTTEAEAMPIRPSAMAVGMAIVAVIERCKQLRLDPVIDREQIAEALRFLTEWEPALLSELDRYTPRDAKDGLLGHIRNLIGHLQSAGGPVGRLPA